ncbi:hypothetical protein [Ruminococcus albus]|uniref:hypothetical protein n=1 Tax=Ruminococcus albus TaxID=1264 RepID=UPI003D6C77B0
MIDHCTSLTALNLSEFDTGNVKNNMRGMFSDCSNLNSITLVELCRTLRNHLANTCIKLLFLNR